MEDRRRPRAAARLGLDICAGFTGLRRFLGATRAHSCVHARGPLRDARQPTAMVIRRRPFDRWSAMPTVVLLSLTDTESLAARFLGILNLDLLLDETSRAVNRTGENYALIFVFFSFYHFLVEDARTPNEGKNCLLSIFSKNVSIILCLMILLLCAWIKIFNKIYNKKSTQNLILRQQICISLYNNYHRLKFRFR